jgi:hypothetical protein
MDAIINLIYMFAYGSIIVVVFGIFLNIQIQKNNKEKRDQSKPENDDNESNL